MRKKICQLCMLVISLTLVIGLVINVSNQNQVEAEDESIPTDDSFFVINEDGEIEFIDPTEEDMKQIKEENENQEYKVVVNDGEHEEVIAEYDNYADAEDTFDQITNQEVLNKAARFSVESSTNDINTDDVQILLNDEPLARSNTYNIVKFKRTIKYNSSGDEYVANINYTEVDTNRSGYLNPTSVADAAYIKMDGSSYICKVGGVVIKVKASDVAGTPTYQEADNNKNLSYYTVSGGKLYHYYSYYLSASNISRYSTTVGYKPSYLDSGKKYYSYDGHYFYTTFEKMINDYRNNTYKNSVNYSNPYYNYYQYVSLRSKTNLSAEQLNNRINNVVNTPTSSKMYNKAQAFIDAQNKYGVNALVMFGIACNETAYGTSNIAKTKNNLFGLNAVDSSPGQSANYFASVEQCINEFAYEWMSKGYLDSYDSRYRGPHLGDKHSGLNVKYASDPFWGEKAASQGYSIDTSKVDYNHYSIGIGTADVINVYNQANPKSTILYNSEAVVSSGQSAVVYDYPLLVLGKVTGSDGQTWYKVQTDVPLDESRTKRDVNALYDFSNHYGYVKANEVTLLGQVESTYSKGDVSLDGKISPTDYVLVRRYLLKTVTLSSTQIEVADMNSDGKISPTDYVGIRKILLNLN